MRIFIAVLVVAFAAALWWSVRGTSHDAAAPRVEATSTTARPAPAPQAVAPTELVYALPRAAPADPASPGLASQPPPPLEFVLLAAVIIAGQQPALTLLVDGNAVTVREGDVVSGYRVERIDRDRVALVHVASGERSERLYADAAPASSPATVASGPAPAGPFATPAQPSGPVPANPAGSRTATRSATMATPPPPVNYLPPRPPAGATVHDNPLVGAILPSVPGQAPAGMSGPRPSALRPGDPVPQGPMPIPVPPNAQGPTRR